jgi:hypothetical protein
MLIPLNVGVEDSQARDALPIAEVIDAHHLDAIRHT